MNALLMDNLQGVRQIKAFGREAHEDERFADRADDLRQGTLGIMRVWAAYSPAMALPAALGMALVLWVGGRQVLADRMTLGKLVGFMFYLALFYEPIARLHGLNQMLQAARAAGERVFDILDAPVERANALPPATLRTPVRGEVSLRKRRLQLPPDRLVLRNISLHARPGEWSRWSAPPAPANPLWSICCRPFTSRLRPHPDRRPGHQQRHARIACAPTSAWSARKPSSSTAPSAKTSSTAGSTPPKRN